MVMASLMAKMEPPLDPAANRSLQIISGAGGSATPADTTFYVDEEVVSISAIPDSGHFFVSVDGEGYRQRLECEYCKHIHHNERKCRTDGELRRRYLRANGGTNLQTGRLF